MLAAATSALARRARTPRTIKQQQKAAGEQADVQGEEAREREVPSAGPGPPMASFSRPRPPTATRSGSRSASWSRHSRSGPTRAGRRSKRPPGRKPQPHGGPKDQLAGARHARVRMLCTMIDNEHRQQHVGRVVVHRPQQPSAGDVGLQEIDAFPGGLRAGAVVDPEKEAGDRLDAEGERDGARPDLAPARPARHRRSASRPHQSPKPVRSLNQKSVFIVGLFSSPCRCGRSGT